MHVHSSRSGLVTQVPIPLYLMTHAYFCFYHALANVVIRTVRSAVQHIHPWAPALAEGVTVFAMGYIMALGETVTIAHFPYYSFQVRGRPGAEVFWLPSCSGHVTSEICGAQLSRA